MKTSFFLKTKKSNNGIPDTGIVWELRIPHINTLYGCHANPHNIPWVGKGEYCLIQPMSYQMGHSIET